MRMITLTSLTLLFAAGGFTGGALAADVAVPAEKCDAAWSMASPNGADRRRARPGRSC